MVALPSAAWRIAGQIFLHAGPSSGRFFADGPLASQPSAATVLKLALACADPATAQGLTAAEAVKAIKWVQALEIGGFEA